MRVYSRASVTGGEVLPRRAPATGSGEAALPAVHPRSGEQDVLTLDRTGPQDRFT
jgi:hypothetical protein